MTPDTIRTLAMEIVQQTFLQNWLIYVMIACLTLIFSAAGAFFSSYLSKRAERLAIAADFDDLKKQLTETTSITESIKVELQHLSARSQKIEQLKREKLEEYLVSVLRGVEYLSFKMRHHYFDTEQPTGDNPLQAASMLQKLYLPELDEAHKFFLSASASFQSWLADGMQEQVDNIKAGKGKGPPSKAHLSAYPNHLEQLNASVLQVEQVAKEIASEINKG